MVLGAAAIVSKLLGSIYTIVLQNMIGDRGMGLYQMAYPIYATLLIISTAGFPVAVSKFVSEHAAVGDLRGAQKIYRVSLALLAVMGFACAIALYQNAGFFARLSGDPMARAAIQAIAPALFIVPVLSSMRGYFQGWQLMNPTASSQVVEQIVRVVTIIAGAYVLLRFGFGVTMAAAAAAFGAVTGGVAGAVVMIGYFWRYRHPRDLARAAGVRRSVREDFPVLATARILKQLLYYAIPVSIGALTIPIMSNVDAMTVTNMLKVHGLPQAMATREFGLLSGRAFKLMTLPAALASSVGTALMPSVSEAHALRDLRDTAARVLTGLRVTLLFALPSAVGLFVLARPIDIALFRNGDGFHSIEILGFATFFASIQIAAAASLQGLGAVYLPVRSLLVGTAIKVALNFMLVPRLGIDGAALSTAVSYAVAAIWNVGSLLRLLHLRLPWVDYVLKPVAATFAMGAFTFAVYAQWQRTPITLPPRMGAAAVTMAGVALGTMTYGFMLVLIGSVREGELQTVPKVGVQLARMFRWLGLFAG